ncbi:MAG TPA: VOC family protein [Sphingobium sp.]|uniref:VOC family protein n=1 Tax=Sphingobium sp. TaxID=1912891 RepID=UPI002ED61775
MAVLGFSHLNVRTPDFARTLAFLRDALGMEAAPPPRLDATDKAAWIYDSNGGALLHLASAEILYSPTEILPQVAPRGSGAIHHVAFSCSDYASMRARLINAAVDFRENEPETGVRQIFVEDPTGIMFELNFQES